MQLAPPIPQIVVLMETAWYLQWDFWLSAVTFLLALGTLWVALETRLMRRGSDRAMAEMTKHAASSAHAAATSAAATKALAEIGQRPWISVKFISLEGNISSSAENIMLSTTFLNTGATPANDILAYHYSLVTSEEFPDNPPYPSTPASTPIPMTMPANDKRTVRVRIPIASGDAERLVKREGSLYAYGVATYRDGFGNSHRTTWCSKYNGGIGDGTRFSHTGKHESIE